MVSDLLFSVLPREGKEPIAHAQQKVAKIEKSQTLRALSDEEQELRGEEREARKKQQDKQQSEEEAASEPDDNNNPDSPSKKPKGPKHLDVYV